MLRRVDVIDQCERSEAGWRSSLSRGSIASMDAATFDVMWWSAGAAILGVARSIEALNPRIPASPELLRVALIIWLGVLAIAGGYSWFNALQLLLMPLGAYTFARGLSAPVARNFARREDRD